MIDERPFFDTGIEDPASVGPVDPAPARHAESATQTDERPRAEPQSSLTTKKKVQPNVLIGIGVVLAIAVLAGWTMLDPAPATRPLTTPVSTTATTHESATAVPGQTSPRAEEGEIVMPPSDLEAASNTPAATATADAPHVTEPAHASSDALTPAVVERIGPLEARIAKAEASLSHVEGSLATVSDSLATLTAAVTDLKAARASKTASVLKASRTPNRAVATAKVTSNKGTEKSVRALDGALYNIHTISRGIAWIQAGDHLEIVQPGDRIGLVRVLSIDPVDRKVVTTDGVIR